jgi:hypothetical protein
VIGDIYVSGRIACPADHHAGLAFPRAFAPELEENGWRIFGGTGESQGSSQPQENQDRGRPHGGISLG